MPIIKFTAEDIRDPGKSTVTLVHTEDAHDCYGETCGIYYEENGKALQPSPHSHLLITGQDPATTPWRYPISK